ncbi:MAG: hypothetical protein ABI811_12910 [Acidobacteriota bacterium]
MARFPTFAIFYLAALFAWNVYRAATQAFTTDEAYSYKLYIGVEPFNLLHQFDANLHVLHSFATWISVKMLGLTELTFRLPSLAGCALYFWATLKITERTQPIALFLLTVNPLIEDNMSVGRGYGLALAFFAWAFAGAIEEVPRLPRIGLFLALSVACNLTFLFPAAGLIAALMIQHRSALIRELTGPWLVIAVLFMGIPLSRLSPDALYFGAPTVALSLQTLLEHSYGAQHISLEGGVIAGAIFLVACMAAALWAFRKSERFAFLATATFVLTAAAVMASHTVFGMLLPYARTGLYFLFLAPLCMIPLARWKAGVAALAALTVVMASTNHSSYYMEWRFDASSREIAQLIADRRQSSGAVRVAAAPPLESALRIYAQMRGAAWNIERANQWEPGFDFYVFYDDDKSIQTLGLHEIYSNPVSRIRVATP